jgi:hypothetical protein
MKMADHGGIVAKSCLVAKESSVAAILSYSTETTEVFIKLMKERVKERCFYCCSTFRSHSVHFNNEKKHSSK